MNWGDALRTVAISSGTAGIISLIFFRLVKRRAYQDGLLRAAYLIRLYRLAAVRAGASPDALLYGQAARAFECSVLVEYHKRANRRQRAWVLEYGPVELREAIEAVARKEREDGEEL